MSNAPVILVSSIVARGSVGLRAMGFTLERLGFATIELPTIVLPHHPEHGPGTKIIPAASDFNALVEDLIQRSSQPVSAIVTGYFADPAQVESAARLVEEVKAANPQAIYLCDPVIGDGDRLYIAENIAAAVRDRLLPLADIATPNLFECGWLTGSHGAREPADDAAALPAPTTVVTSIPALMRGQIGTLLSGADGVTIAEHRMVQTPIKGTGDVFAAVFLARRLRGESDEAALQAAAASTYEMLAASAAAGAEDLLLAEFQTSLVQPRTQVAIRRLARPQRRDAAS